MRLTFSVAAAAWVVGKALADLNPQAKYVEYLRTQTFTVDRLVVRLDDLNSAIGQISMTEHPELGGVPKYRAHGFRPPSGRRYQLDQATWLKFKDWLGRRGQIVAESENSIEITDPPAGSSPTVLTAGV